MASIIDLWSHNIGFDLRRKSSRRQPHRPNTTTMQPALDTSSGILAIRYSGSDDSSAVSTPNSEGSEGSFTEISVDGGVEATVVRPMLPKRHASHRMTRSVEEERPTTPVAPADTQGRPPIPPKSPYRASQVMVRLQNELAEMPEDEDDTPDQTALRLS